MHYFPKPKFRALVEERGAVPKKLMDLLVDMLLTEEVQFVPRD
jgi:hypothetical protein